MRNPQKFLITYGLHNFVGHSQKNNKHVFFIGSSESRKMICHAENLITRCFNEAADIHVV